MAERVDATDLKSVGALPRGGSSPPLGTQEQLVRVCLLIRSAKRREPRLELPQGAKPAAPDADQSLFGTSVK